jgi:chromosome segregation protein
MHLKRLEIHGFKSFAQKTTLEFAPGVIAIVGPNGSGKSNVADSLRWVLGEQSSKLMRGKKSDDVIFAGSDKKTKLGFAEVVATFDNKDHRIPVDSSEVSIGRRIDRSGESEYLINGNKVRLLDIVDLVLRSNIGTSRYTVIGQGTIDQMILAGPSEVKNLIDEASGVKTYYIKRDKTLRRLEQTAQNLMRAEDLIAEIEPRLKSLRRQAKKMEARADLETELKVHQRDFFGKIYWELHELLQGFNGNLSEIAKQRSEREQYISELRTKIDQLEDSGGARSSQFHGIQESIAKLQTQKNKFLEDLSLVRGKMQGQKTANVGDAQTLQVELHGKARKALELREKIAAAENEHTQLNNSLFQKRHALDDLTKKLNSLYATSKNPVQIDWSLFDLELKSLDESFESFYSKVGTAENVQEIRQTAESFKTGFSKFKDVAKETLRNPQQTLEAFQQELEKVLHEKDQMNAMVGELELSLSKTKFSTEFLEKELRSTEQEKLHLELELKKAQSGSSDDFWQSLTVEEDRINKETEILSGEITSLENQLKQYYDQDTDRQRELKKAEFALREKQDEVSKIRDQESAIQIEKAKVDTQRDVLLQEIRLSLGESILAEIEQRKVTSTTPDVTEKIARLKNQLEMIGGIDDLTLQEYHETESRFTNLSGQVSDLKQGMADLRQIIDELDEHIKVKFNEAFHRINEKFENYFRILFNGGRAYLSVLKSDDPVEELELEAETDNKTVSQMRPEERILQKYEKGPSSITGIDIKATPPNKKLASIQALSGGERALTSIALLCSLLTCFPSPFVVLDEVDAALDDANTIRFGQIVGSLAHQTQFITITHNRETMSQAAILYGVTMGDDGISKLLSVKIDQAKQYAK